MASLVYLGMASYGISGQIASSFCGTAAEAQYICNVSGWFALQVRSWKRAAG